MVSERKSSEIFGEGRVQLIDPNLINVNTDLKYPTPKYEEMFIYVDFKGVRRGRTVIETSTAGNAIFANTINEADTNFMGYDSSDGDTFTTSWYEDDREEGHSTSAFGIESINVKINSSYIPEVQITFIDVRGMEFFNKTNSPYRMLFDFPPPLFELKVKGYYGKTIKYILHLVSYDTSFDDTTGNYIIEGKFVSVTFAPLSDIPFKYLTQFSVLENYNFDSFDPKSTTAPRNTFELIHKIKYIYSELNDLVNKDQTFEEHNLSLQKYNNLEEALNILYDVKNNKLIEEGGVSNIMILTKNSDGVYTEEFLTDIKDYTNYSNLVTENDFRPQLYLTYFNQPYNSSNKNLSEIDFNTTTPILSKEYNSLNSFGVDFINRLNSLELPNETFYLGRDVKIKKYQIINQPGNVVEHYICDLTIIYQKLNRLKKSQAERTNEIANQLKEEINDLVYQRLGMNPTIYNIFNIILRDVDNFFKRLRQTSEDAEVSHTKNINKLRSFVDEFTEDKIYSFPLIVTNGKRSSPNQLKNILYEMPELVLVNRFIESFKYIKSMEEVLTLPTSTNADGEHLWIPLSAQDSSINFSENPYYTMNNNIEQILFELTKRYYALSNIIIHGDFFESERFINFYAKSEAINIVNSLSNANKKNVQNLKNENVRRYRANIENFYTYVENNFPDIYNLPENQRQILPLKGFNNNYISINKTSNEFIGILIDNTVPEVREINVNNPDGTAKIINDYITQLQTNGGFFGKIRNFLNIKPDVNFNFNKINLLYLDDEIFESSNGEASKSKFFISYNLTATASPTERQYGYRVNNYIRIADESTLDEIIENGNQLLPDFSRVNNRSGTQIYRLWEFALHKINTTTQQKLYEYLNIENNDISLILLLSAFGNVASPYNIMPNGINSFMSKYPMGVAIPQSVLYYMGGLVKLIKDNNESDLINFVKNNHYGLLDHGSHLLADISDIKKYMSENDKNTLLSQYNFFKSNFGITLVNIYNNIISEPEDIYNNLSENESFNNIILKRQTLYIGSNLAFKFQKDSTLIIQDFNQINNSPSDKSITDSFFVNLFTELDNLLKKKLDDLKNVNTDELKLKYDSDIVDETYYSFKNINDKWIAGTNQNTGGYPFSETGRLIDSFAFVDRTMSPINDTIINPEILVDIYNDNSVSVFTAISQILSLNNFEFFPLQNFMNFERPSGNGENNDSLTEWENAFKIDPTGEITTEPAFICMYIGGGSSYPTNISDRSLFKDDGILRFGNDDDLDFNVSSPRSYDKEYLGKIKSFRVRFGEQNQSMFNGFKVDSKEYAETNESLQILSRIAGDQNQEAQIPLSQSLFNVYRDRSYSARISGLGNATLQPTQYFQLEGVSIFNGVYIILDVEHNINKNYFTSNFGGMKILKYPIPPVNTVSASFGLELGGIDDAKSFERNERKIAYTGDSNTLPEPYKINSMFDFKNNTRKLITENGKNYMLSLADENSDSMLRGEQSYPLPFTNIQKEWISNAYYKYGNDREWMKELIIIIEKYAQQFDIDPNMIAAQIQTESSFKVWVFPPPAETRNTTSSAVGLTQFIYPTLYKTMEKFFTNEERKLITGENYDSLDYFTLPSYDTPSRPFIAQNIIDNPELMVKAQCAHMKELGNQGNNLMSTSLMGYHGGSGFTKSNFIESIKKPNSDSHYKYAYKIMKKMEINFGYEGLVSSPFDDFAANASYTSNGTN